MRVALTSDRARRQRADGFGRRLGVALATGLIIAGVAGPAASAATSGSTTVTVNAQTDLPGLDTGLSVTAGTQMQFSASGTADYCGGICPTAPPGDPNHSDSNAVLPSAPVGALIGEVVGSSSSSGWFLIGNSAQVTAPINGELFLIYNDVPGAFANNSGSYNVTISSQGGSGGDSALSNTGEPNAVLALQGGALNQGVAFFSDPDSAATSSTYNIGISWGDGTASQGAAAPFANGWQVLAQHTFNRDGGYRATVTITDLGSSDEAGGSVLVIPVTFSVLGTNPQTPSQSDKTVDNKASATLNVLAAGGAGCAVAATAGVISAPIGLGCGAFSAVTWGIGSIFSFFGADPPDPNFTVIPVPHFPRIPTVRSAGQLTPAIATAFNNLVREQAIEVGTGRAMLLAIERAQGAQQAGQRSWETQQILTAATYAHSLAVGLRKEVTLRQKLGRLLHSAGIASLRVPLNEVRRIQNQVARRGFPKNYVQLLKDVGLDHSARQQIRKLFLQQSPRRLDKTLGTLAAGQSLLTMLKAEASALDAYSAQVRAHPLL